MDLHRFAFSTQSYSRHPLKKVLKRIAKTGFKGVEISADKPHLWLDQLPLKEASRLSKQLEKLDLFVSTIDATCTTGYWSDAPAERLSEPSLISRNNTLREWRIAYTKKALRLAREIGVDAVTVSSGKLLNGITPEKAQRLLHDSLSRLLELAEHLGQRIAFVCEPSHYIESTSELSALLKSFNSAYLGACLNVGHAEMMGEDANASIRLVKNRLFHVQLMDVRGRQHYAHVPGDGEIDFRTVFRTLDAVGYNGPLTWQLAGNSETPDNDCLRALKYVKTLVLERSLNKRPAAVSNSGISKTKAKSKPSKRIAS